MAYSQEYKDYICKLIVDENRVVKEVAYELNIPYSTLGRWVKNYKKTVKPETISQKDRFISSEDHQKVLSERDKEILKLKEENEILKKAMHIFTKNQE
ncbi:transposase [Oceanobacillus iheyensis]|uniref:transposase n=1 Tax=Oceanobacillus iheyensis TaxID=182710 RepID=UPI0036409EFD